MKPVSATIEKILKDDLFTLSAALAYYALLSLAPLCVGALLVWSFFPISSSQDLFLYLQRWLGSQASDAVRMVLEQTQKPNLRALAGVLAVLSILVFGTAVFSQLQASLDKIWNRQGPFFRNLLIQRLISVGIFLVLVLFLFISFLTGLTIQGLEYRTSLSVSTLLPILFWTLLSVCLGGFYRWLSYRKMTWRASLAAGGIVASLLTLGKVGFRWYVTTAAIGSAYGAAGVFIIFLLWVFYTSLIFLIGAEIAFALTYNFFAHRVIK